MARCDVRGAGSVFRLPEIGAVLLFSLPLVFAGCGGGPQLAEVAGAVTLDGTPLKFGSVVFQHVEGGQPARADIAPDGSFQLSTFRQNDGARVGKNRVQVTCYKSQDPALANAGPTGDSLGPSLIPRRYTRGVTSGIVVEVPAEGLDGLAIELDSKRR